MLATDTLVLTCHPTRRQKEIIAKTVGCQRFIWNHFLSAATEHRKRYGSRMAMHRMVDELHILIDEKPWLSIAPVNTLTQTIQRLYHALKSKGVAPAFRSRNSDSDYAEYTDNFRISEKGVKLPLIGRLSCKPRLIPQRESIKKITISIDRQTGRHILKIAHSREIPEFPKTGSAIGLDVGYMRLYTDSSGDFTPPIATDPKVVRLATRIRREKSKFDDILAKSRENPGQYANILALKRKAISGLHRKYNSYIHNLLHQYSSRLVKNHDLIAIEKLKVRSSRKNRKRLISAGKPPKKQCHTLYDNWINVFFRMLEYKCRWRAKKLAKVNPGKTSQTCSSCGFTSPKNRRSQNRFKCRNCGASLNADHNAAINILNMGLAQTNSWCPDSISPINDTRKGYPLETETFPENPSPKETPTKKSTLDRFLWRLALFPSWLLARFSHFNQKRVPIAQ